MFLLNQLHPDTLGKKIQLCRNPMKDNSYIFNYLQGKDPSIQKHRRTMFCFGGGLFCFFNLFKTVLESVAIKKFLQQLKIN